MEEEEELPEAQAGAQDDGRGGEAALPAEGGVPVQGGRHVPGGVPCAVRHLQHHLLAGVPAGAASGPLTGAGGARFGGTDHPHPPGGRPKGARAPPGTVHLALAAAGRGAGAGGSAGGVRREGQEVSEGGVRHAGRICESTIPVHTSISRFVWVETGTLLSLYHTRKLPKVGDFIFISGRSRHLPGDLTIGLSPPLISASSSDGRARPPRRRHRYRRRRRRISVNL